MFYDLAQEYGTQKVRYVSVLGLEDHNETARQILRYVQMDAVILPIKSSRKFFYDVSYLKKNGNMAYGGVIDLFSCTVLLDEKVLKHKNLTPKQDDFIILATKFGGYRRHSVSSFEETIEDFVELTMKAPNAIANNDVIEARFTSTATFGDSYDLR